jgi:hypothetical protein
MTSDIRISQARLRKQLRSVHDADAVVQVTASDLRCLLEALVPWADPSPGFGWALAKMEDGCLVRRKGWPDDRDLRLVLEHEVYSMPDPNRPSELMIQRGGPEISHFGVEDVLGGAEISHVDVQDILAYDWEIRGSS